MSTLAAAPRPKGALTSLAVASVTHYTDDLFAFCAERPQGLRFRSGEFVMLGLPGPDGRPIMRAYSIASPNWADELEFFSIKVPDGPLTSRLSAIAPGDEILIKPRSTGTLVLDALTPGRTLWLVSTGTGIAPFASIVRDPETYERFDDVVLTHTSRTRAELAYGFDVLAAIDGDPMVREFVGERLTHVATVTREAAHPPLLRGRITELIASGALFEAVGRPRWSADDRVMICGSAAMIGEVRALCEAAGLAEGSNAQPGGFVIEKAFVG